MPTAAAFPVGIVHDGDRLPLGMRVYGALSPLPSAVIWAPAPAREPNTDPRRLLIVNAGWAPTPAANTLTLSRPPDALLVPAERLAQTAVLVPVAFPPGARVLLLSAPRDEAAPTPDRLAPTTVIVPIAPYPNASVLAPPVPHGEMPGRLALTRVVVSAVLPAPGLVVAIGRITDVVVAPQHDRGQALVVIHALSQPPGAVIRALYVPRFAIPRGSLRVGWAAFSPGLVVSVRYPGIAAIAIAPEINAIGRQATVSAIAAASNTTIEDV